MLWTFFKSVGINLVYSWVVFILSGTVTWMQRWDELKQLGAIGYISKPFERTKIKELIERCLMGHRNR